MRSRNLVFALLALAVASCDDGGISKAGVSTCTLDLAMAPDGTLMLKGDCPRDARGIAAAIERAPGTVKSAGEIALGRTTLGPAGAFDRCAIMARLAADPRWTASVDSDKAIAPFHDALLAEGLAPPISTALVKAERKLRGVSLEKILLSDGPATDCPTSPARVPTEAQMWLSLE